MVPVRAEVKVTVPVYKAGARLEVFTDTETVTGKDTPADGDRESQFPEDDDWLDHP